MSNFDVSITARFANQLGAGTRNAERDLKGVANAAKAIERVDFGSKLRAQLQSVVAGARAASDHLERMGKVTAGVVAGVEAMRRMLATPAMADADFADKMIDIGQKTDMTKEKLSSYSDEVKKMAERMQVAPLTMANAIDTVLSSISDLALGTSLSELAIKVAKTYRAVGEEVSGAMVAMYQNMDVPANQMELALGRMAQAAADGRYEIKNFARGMPELAAQMKNVGQLGLPAVSRLSAMLEVAATSVGNPEQATTNVQQMLAKFQSPDVRRNFKKKGINVEKLIDGTKKNGGDIMETIYGALMKATKGDSGKVINFFGDEQARNAAVALMQNIKMYREMRDRYNAINTPDKLNSDLALRQGGPGNTFRTFGERWDAMMTAIGKGVNSWLAPAVDFFGRLADHITRAAEAMPKLAGAIALAGAAWAGYTTFKTVTGILGKLGAGAAAAPAAAAAGAVPAAAPVASAGPGLLGGLLARLASSPSLAGAGVMGLGWLGSKALETAFNPRPWTVNGREDGQARLRELQDQRAEVARRIADIQGKSKVPEMAESLAAPFKTKLADLDNEIRAIEEEMRKLDAMTITPKINVFEIERALKLLRDLQGAAAGLGGSSPSFMDNAAPAAKTGGGKQSAAPRNATYNVAGYSPSAIARRIAREERRGQREAEFGALHDLGALA